MIRALVYGLAIFAALIVACPLSATEGATEKGPVKIFCDTDMLTDCDDAGALAVLHALADAGECEILATVCCVREPKSVAVVEAINRYYSRPDLPVGFVRGEGVLMPSKFVGPVAAEFPSRFRTADEIPDAVQVYRDVLKRQPDQSVVVVTLGYMTNLKNLLELPASDDQPSGRELVRQKVRQWVCLGGNFIGKPPRDELKLNNVNFQRDPRSAAYAIANWPGPIVFVGREIGSVPSGLELGVSLAKTPKTNPVRRAYEHYFGGTLKNRHVADLTAVLFAVRGSRDYWDVETEGYMDLQPDMKFIWKTTPDRDQSYLLKKWKDGKPNDDYIEQTLDELLTREPKRR
jgi:hypothetical protein